MAFTGKVMGDGQLAATKTAIYTVGSGKTAYVKRLSIFNDDADEQTVVVYVNVSGASRKWRRYVLTQNESADVLDHGDSLLLEAGDSIEAESTDASAVDYFVMGVEESS